MKSLLVYILILISFTTLAQNTLKKFQYWFDNNFSTQQTINVNSVNVNIYDSLNVNTLSPGFHTLYFRFLDNQGKWSVIESKYFLKTNVQLSKQIKWLEYWFDNNHSSSVKISQSSTQLMFIDSILVNFLSPGFHTFNFRVQDSDGKYSCIFNMYFIKVKKLSNKLTHLEYWFDNSNWSASTVNISTQQMIFLDSLQVNALSSGFHLLNFRFRDFSKKWSSVQSMIFYKVPASITNKLTTLEYWFDNQYANAHQINMNSSSVVFIDSLNVFGLTPGMHVLNVRLKDIYGQWSSIDNKFIYKPESLSGNVLTELQYWFDNNQQTLILPITSQQFVLFDSLSVANIPSGMHVINFRFKDNAGKWSTIINKYFYKVDPLYGNTIRALSYWFNNNDNQAYSININNAQLVFIDSLNTSSLPEGMHVLNIRLRDAANKWSSVVKKYFYKIEPLYGNKIHKVQYWFDNESSNTTSVMVHQSNMFFIDSVVVNNLPEGMHVFNFRVIDYVGKWSPVIRKYFYKVNFYNSTITAYQYWFNNNYNHSVYTQANGLANIVWIDSLSIAQLPVGMHTINIRFKDSYNKWSVVTTKYIYRTPQIDNKMIAYRYWLNNNFNQSVYSNIGNPDLLFVFLDSISLTSVPAGNVLVHFQFKDIYGQWSTVTTDTTDKQPIPVASFNYTTQYYCDSVKVNFINNSIDGNKFIWNFGDGTIDSTQNPIHSFFTSGIYTITLTAIDTIYGRDSTISLPININVPTHIYYDTSIVACDYYYWLGNYYNNSGTYTQTIPHNYCDSTVTIYLTIYQTPALNLGNDTILCVNYGQTSLLLNAGVAQGYVWFNGSTTPTLWVDSSMANNGILHAYVTTNNENCYNSDTITIVFTNCTDIVGNENLFENIEISPNPFSDKIVVSNASQNWIEIYDLQGRIMFKKLIDQNRCLLNLEKLSQGTYTVKIFSDKKNIVKKIVKS